MADMDEPGRERRERDWTTEFDDRYGRGASARLMAMLEQPCTSFAEIAERFGVTRECVRRWHVKRLPNAPRGHERQRLCSMQARKRRLLTDPLFRSFYRHARSHVQPNRFVLVPAHDGFKKREVRLDHCLIALREGRRTARPGSGGGAFTLASSPHLGADFIYYRLAEDDYLLLPREAIPPHGTTFLATEASKYERFRNTFAAVLSGYDAQQQAS
jgi:hypothetical protein